MTAIILTQSRLKELVRYYPDTGYFTWKERNSCDFIEGKHTSNHTANKWNSTYAGKYAGSFRSSGYISITIEGKAYQAHRLSFLYMEGRLPPNQCDHINHIRNDNKWLNLRHATSAENGKNQSMRCTNTSGYIGVYWSKAAKKWTAEIWVNGDKKYLGLFVEIRQAIIARKAADYKYNFHINHGKTKGELTCQK